MLTMNLQLFGGRGSTGGNKASELKVIRHQPFIERNGKYIDQIESLSKRPKETIKDFKENKTSITITESDGTKTKITPELTYGSDAGRKYAANNTKDYSVFTQNSIYKDNKGSHYLVTKEYTTRINEGYGGVEINTTSRIKKISKLH